MIPDRSKAVVLVQLLFFVASWFLLEGVSCWALSCSLFSRSSVPFSIVITSIGEEIAGLYPSHAFVHFLSFISSSVC